MAENNVSHKLFVSTINFFCLMVAMNIILALPHKKEIWYDETVSILCSKGISHDTQSLFAKDTAVSSSAIAALNTPRQVFNATVVDNGNSFLYNIGLHWFSQLFGNKVGVYMAFSRLWAIAALTAFYLLCRFFFKDSLFISLALVLLATDTGFTAMSHEIRAYSMGIFFVTLSASCLFKYLSEERPRWLFLTGLFSAAAILSHFLAVYMVLAFLGILLWRKGRVLLSARNIVAIAVPASLLALYFFFSIEGIRTMSLQNHEIQEQFTKFNIAEVAFRSMKIMAVNFKIAYPMFRDNRVLFLACFLFVPFLYIAGVKAAADRKDKVHLHTLFICGAASSVFLVLLSLKSHHYASLYFRYYSFGLPFSSLFVAYLLYVFYKNDATGRVLKAGLFLVILVPVFALFAITLKNEQPAVHYNHAAIATEIVNYRIQKVTVPEWRDAFLLQAFLPRGYKIDYFRNDTSADFILYTAGGAERIPVIREDR